MPATSQHILNASANLLGFCLVVITSLRLVDRAEAHAIHAVTSLVAVLLTLSCLLSFISIRATHQTLARRCETIADYLFITALLGLLLVILVMTQTFV